MSQTSQRLISNIVKSRFTPFAFAIIAITLRLVMFLSLGLIEKQYPTSFVWNLISPIFQTVSFAFASTTSILLIAFTISNKSPVQFNSV